MLPQSHGETNEDSENHAIALKECTSTPSVQQNFKLVMINAFYNGVIEQKFSLVVSCAKQFQYLFG